MLILKMLYDPADFLRGIVQKLLAVAENYSSHHWSDEKNYLASWPSLPALWWYVMFQNENLLQHQLLLPHICRVIAGRLDFSIHILSPVLHLPKYSWNLLYCPLKNFFR